MVVLVIIVKVGSYLLRNYDSFYLSNNDDDLSSTKDFYSIFLEKREIFHRIVFVLDDYWASYLITRVVVDVHNFSTDPSPVYPNMIFVETLIGFICKILNLSMIMNFKVNNQISFICDRFIHLFVSDLINLHVVIWFTC